MLLRLDPAMLETASTRIGRPGVHALRLALEAINKELELIRAAKLTIEASVTS